MCGKAVGCGGMGPFLTAGHNPALEYNFGMHVTIQENEKYGAFVSEVAQEMGVFDIQPEQLVWHSTNGAGFLGIIQSASIHATQVASLNDKSETKYATQVDVTKCSVAW
jgi:hypothetical protein